MAIQTSIFKWEFPFFTVNYLADDLYKSKLKWVIPEVLKCLFLRLIFFYKNKNFM